MSKFPEDAIIVPHKKPEPEVTPSPEPLFKQILKKYFPGLDEYWKDHVVPYSDEAPLPPVYHGTRLSALPSIKMDGLIPHNEFDRPTGRIFATLNPQSAAVHIVGKSNFDTYAPKLNITVSEDSINPILKVDQETINENDPPLILKIDIRRYYEEHLWPTLPLEKILKSLFLGQETGHDQSLESIIEQIHINQKRYLEQIDDDGIGISGDPIPPKYIKVLALGLLNRSPDGKIEEISLDEAYARLMDPDPGSDLQQSTRSKHN